MTYFTLSGLKSFSLTIKQFVKDNESDGHLATFICTIVELILQILTKPEDRHFGNTTQLEPRLSKRL